MSLNSEIVASIKRVLNMSNRAIHRMYTQKKNYILQLKVSRFHDDGLIILRNCDGPTTDRIRKGIIRIFKQIGFKIEIKTNLKEVDFLDVTFDL